jgi:hypothetical protein
MLSLKLEKVFFSGYRPAVRQDGSSVFYLTFTNTDGRVIRATVSSIPSGLDDFLFQPVNGEIKDVSFLGSEAGGIVVRADSFELT